MQFVGKVLNVNDNEIQFALQNFNDTITLERTLVKQITDYENIKDKMILEHGRFHKKAGWVNSFSLSLGPNENYYGFSTQLEYQGYKLVSPKVGLGGGTGLKLHGGEEFGYEDYRNYMFLELSGYAKFYLNNSRRRIYLDTKMGYGIPLASVTWRCYGCDDPENLRHTTYTGGVIFQPGIGVEFANTNRFRSGFKLSTYLMEVKQWTGEKPDDGGFRNGLAGVLLGFNFYF